VTVGGTPLDRWRRLHIIPKMQETIISVLVTAAAIWGGFFLKNWVLQKIKSEVQHEYDRKLESHKSQLRIETEKEIAQFKSQLTIAEAERSFRFSHVFEQTAKVITITYEKLYALKDAADDFAQRSNVSEQLRAELQAVFNKQMDEFKKYFMPNKLYIPRETAEQIVNLVNAFFSANLQRSMALAEAKSPLRDPEMVKMLNTEFRKSQESIPKLLELLQDDFQLLLGIRVLKPSGGMSKEH
jgi:hypothetical protein